MLAHWFTTIIYQPFLNILVLFYWVMDMVTGGHPDMGFAVILLTIVIRLLLLPISLAEERSEKDRREMARLLREAETKYSSDPIVKKREVKKLFKVNQGVVVAEVISLVVQIVISLMLWRIFATGLTGEDLHLIYPFMPKVTPPFNLIFLGKFDLTHTNVFLNLLQSFMIFLVETATIVTSPYPPMKGEVVRLQLVLPVVSFLVFMYLPAGKKLFIISALTISLVIIIYKYIRRRWQDYVAKKAEEAELREHPPEPVITVPSSPGLSTPPVEKILVQTKA